MDLHQEGGQPSWLQVDFAVCAEDNGGWGCQLIELQGFPSLYGFYPFLVERYAEAYGIPSGYTPFPLGLDATSYYQAIGQELLGTSSAEKVALVDIDPATQPNLIDFETTRSKWGVGIVGIEHIRFSGGHPFYEVEGNRRWIERIYNRVLPVVVGPSSPLYSTWRNLLKADIDWACHPSWYYRVSKALLPSIEGSFNPECYNLSDIDSIPRDISRFVLKPSYSYGGHGTVLYPSARDVEQARSAGPHVLQRRVNYSPCVFLDGEDIGSKVEIRLLYAWDSTGKDYLLVGAAARLSRGDHMALRYNTGDRGTGLSVCYFEIK